MAKTETLYRLTFAAQLLAVHPRTLKRWNTQGKITLVELPNGDFRMSGTELARIQQSKPADDPEPQTTEAQP